LRIIICRKEKSNGKEKSKKEKSDQEESNQKESQKEKKIMHHLMEKEGLIIAMRPSFL